MSAAAQEIFPRAVAHGVELVGKPAVKGALEKAVVTVSRLRRVQGLSCERSLIQNLPELVFRVFIRQINRLDRQQLAVMSQEGSRPKKTRRSADPSREFELKTLVDEFLTHCDFVTQDIFWRRLQGFSWEDVGKIHNLSGQAAAARFDEELRRARARLRFSAGR